jgi:hypothetical protein
MTVAWDVSPTTVTVLEDGGLVNVTPSQTTVTSGSGSALTHIWYETRTNDLLLSGGVDSSVFSKVLEAGSYYIDATLTLGTGTLSGAGATIFSADIRTTTPGISPAEIVCSSSANHPGQIPNVCGISLNAFLTLTGSTTVYVTVNVNFSNRYARYTNFAGNQSATSWRISKLT